jgi:UDP-N-acetylglucosamine--dolichyl-phosphate N-acetylglucosaminephosphotransferase
MGGISILVGLLVGYGFLIMVIPERASTVVWVALFFAFLGIIGILDDLYAIGQRLKLLLTLVAAAPLIAGGGFSTDLFLPAFGTLHLGVIYAFLLVPLAVGVTVNLANMYAGFNGLEAGIAMIALASCGALAILAGNGWVLLLLAPLIGAAAGFLVFNRFPARIFPGDVGTLVMGGGVGLAAVMGGVEFFAIIVYLPLILDFIFKARVSFSTKQRGHSTVDENGDLTPAPYSSLTHAVMRIARTEKRLVLGLWGVAVLFGSLAIILALLLLPSPGNGEIFRANTWIGICAVLLPSLVILMTFFGIRADGVKLESGVEK